MTRKYADPEIQALTERIERLGEKLNHLLDVHLRPLAEIGKKDEPDD